MKIVLYTEGLPFAGDALERGALGGSESAFIAVARELTAMGHEVHAHCRCPAPGIYDGVHYHAAEEVRRWESENCDIFLCSRFFHVLALSLRARRRYLWMHDILVPPSAASLRGYLDRIDGVFCLSRFHAAQIIQALPEARAKLRVSANGVDLDLVRDATAGAQKRHRILFTSRAERGLEAALDAYEALDDPTLAFLYCSYPPLPDRQVQAIERRCAARMATMRSRGLDVRADSFAKRDLYRAIAESEAVVYPCGFPEIFCISALEAQACGTAFLTIDAFALRETVAYPGLPPDDPAAFLAALRALLGDNDRRSAMEAAGRRHAERYAWTDIAAGFLAAESKTAEPAPMTRNINPADAGEAPVSPPRMVEATPSTPLDTLSSAAASDLPKISCLTVTFDRLAMLKRAIRSYCDQSYPNTELVIVSDGAPRFLDAVADHLAALARNDIRLERISGDRRTLGALRNASIAQADGELICQWDDDDCSHPERLAAQFACLEAEGADACFLTDHLQFFARDRQLLWTDWTYGGRVTGKWQLAPGTLMMRRTGDFRYPEDGETASRGEDSALIDALYGKLDIARLSGAGHLYLYSYHGRNTFPEDHHRGLGNAGAPIEFLQQRETALRRAIDYYDIPRPVSVYGAGGALFMVES